MSRKLSGTESEPAKALQPLLALTALQPSLYRAVIHFLVILIGVYGDWRCIFNWILPYEDRGLCHSALSGHVARKLL